MKNLILMIMIILLLENMAFADLVPATSEDLNDFDKQISASQDSGKSSGRQNAGPSAKAVDKSKDRKGNFGAAVSAEAKKLKDSADPRQGFGKWVSEQRRQNENKPGNNSESNNAGGNSDARNSAPANKDSGSSPGNSGNHKK